MKNDLQLPIPAPEKSPTEAKRAALEKADVESVGDILAAAQAEVARFAALAMPAQETVALCREVLFKKLKERGATRLNHPDLDIEIRLKRHTRIDEEVLRELINLKIDGQPIPPEFLKKAVWFEEIPADVEFKSNKTQVRMLAKRFGQPVADIFQRAYVEVETEYLDVQPRFEGGVR